MMHGWGMGGFGMGFPFVGIIPVLLLGGGIYLVLRAVRDRVGSHGDGRIKRESSAFPKYSGQFTIPDIYRLARRYAGVLTVSNVVVAFDIEPTKAEELLDRLIDGQRVVMDVGSDGVIRYNFREFIVNDQEVV